MPKFNRDLEWELARWSQSNSNIVVQALNGWIRNTTQFNGPILPLRSRIDTAVRRLARVQKKENP